MNMTYASQSITERIIPVEEYERLKAAEAKLNKAVGLLRGADTLLEVEGYPRAFGTIRAEIADFLEDKEVPVNTPIPTCHHEWIWATVPPLDGVSKTVSACSKCGFYAPVKRCSPMRKRDWSKHPEYGNCNACAYKNRLGRKEPCKSCIKSQLRRGPHSTPSGWRPRTLLQRLGLSK